MTDLREKRPDKVVHLKCSETSFFRVWMEFLAPFHHLAAREMDVAAVILDQLFRLRAQCAEPSMATTLLWSQASKSDMRARLGMTKPHFQTIMGKLRRCGFLNGWEVEPRYVPPLDEGEDVFEMLVIFDHGAG